MFDVNTINYDSLQIEISTYCNASCPGCARNHQGGETKKFLPQKHMSLSTWKNLITPENISKFGHFIINGSFGDPLMNPNIIEMLEHLASIKTDINCVIHTNGSLRDEKFFTNLANTMKKFEIHEVVFGIDGLSDTHHIHRRQTKWQKIIENLKTFNNAGGTSVWHMIVFNHNLSQIEECKSMAKNLGCRLFQLRKSYQPSIQAKKFLNYDQTTITSPSYDIVDDLIKKHNVDFVKQKNIGEQNKISFSHSFSKKTQRKICPWVKSKQLQVDVEGNIWPCCYVHEYQINPSQYPEWDINLLNQKFGVKFNSINDKKSISKIVNDIFFQKYVTESWSKLQSPACKDCLGK